MWVRHPWHLLTHVAQMGERGHELVLSGKTPEQRGVPKQSLKDPQVQYTEIRGGAVVHHFT